jgi:NADH:ubiquinone oxidoreductase subunit E
VKGSDSKTLDSSPKSPRFTLELCQNFRGEGRPSCLGAGAKALYKELKTWQNEELCVKPATCLGVCHRGPALRFKQLGQPDQYLGEASLTSIQKVLDEARSALGKSLEAESKNSLKRDDGQ